MSQPTLTVENNAASSRYELRDGDDLIGLAEYQSRPGVIAFTHTEVAPEFGGRGLGSLLVSQALADVAPKELQVLPYCPFVRDYIAAHSEFLPLVPPERRISFGLPA